MTVTPLRVLLRERRRALDMGTVEAAAMCGVSQGAYSRYENGRQPEDSALDGLATFLGVSIREVVLARSADLLGDVPDEVGQLRAEVDELRELVERLASSPSSDTP